MKSFAERVRAKADELEKNEFDESLSYVKMFRKFMKYSNLEKEMKKLCPTSKIVIKNREKYCGVAIFIYFLAGQEPFLQIDMSEWYFPCEFRTNTCVWSQNYMAWREDYKTDEEYFDKILSLIEEVLCKHFLGQF
jgi:hypothetical protein